MSNEEANVRINERLEENEMKEGTVIWFNSEKGFGFIKDEAGRDIFVHFQDIEMEGYKTLEKDEKVEFEIEKTEKGEKAIHVRPIEE